MSDTGHVHIRDNGKLSWAISLTMRLVAAPAPGPSKSVCAAVNIYGKTLIKQNKTTNTIHNFNDSDLIPLFGNVIDYPLLRCNSVIWECG